MSTTSTSNNLVITDKDYEIDYLRDAQVFDENKTKISRSYRRCIVAKEAHDFLLNRVHTTADKVRDEFERQVIEKLREERKLQTHVPHVPAPSFHSKCRCGQAQEDDSSSSSEESDEEKEEEDTEFDEEWLTNPTEDQLQKMPDRRKNNYYLQLEVTRKKNHPNAVHPDVCFNEPCLANDGPVCRCSKNSRKHGLRHGIYAGESDSENCRPRGSAQRYHYYLKVTPYPSENQISRTIIMTNSEELEFEGFSLITHQPLPEFIPKMPISRWSVEYEFTLVEEVIPEECFTISDCDIVSKVMFHDIFELLDFDLFPNKSDGKCPIIHFMPRFVTRRGNITKLLPLTGLMAHLIFKFSSEFVPQFEIMRLLQMDEEQLVRRTNRWKQNIVIRADKRPSAIRVDGFERDTATGTIYMIHNTIKPQAYTNAQNPQLQWMERRYSKMKHLNAMNPSKGYEKSIDELRTKLEEMKKDEKSIRQVKVRIPVDGYRSSGFFPDSIAHILMAVLATHHIRYQLSLNEMEKKLEYRFNNREVLELAMTHSSFKNNYGTNMDHAKTLIANCAYRRKYTQDERKDKKRGIHNLMNIMTWHATMASKTLSPILHNERLEYMGDAVVEMIVTNHLFFMLPHHNEGGLATYRTALVQNRNLASLAKALRMDEFIQFAHGTELCHESDFRHALANAFEALMAAVYLDSGIECCDRIFSKAMFGADPELKTIWDHVNEHDLKVEMPKGDRDLIDDVATLSMLREFEESVGIEFNNIRLLAKALTRRNVTFNNLTKGHNQRMEWLGDTVLQLVISDYLYRHFPNHHEGHLSLLRTSVVSNKTQSMICDDLGLARYIIKGTGKQPELRTKDKADLVEALIGALYVDRGIEHCRAFVRILFLPRLTNVIETNKWNDPKSHLQQKCLSMRDVDNPTPDIPEYRTVRAEGPTNTRNYHVAVYFRKKRLAVGEGPNVHSAELAAAENALTKLKNCQRHKYSSKNIEAVIERRRRFDSREEQRRSQRRQHNISRISQERSERE